MRTSSKRGSPAPCRRRWGRTSTWVAVIVGMSMAAPVAVAGDDFSLTSAVPDDVFICVAARQNAEREFLEQYWAEVFQAACDTGVGDDLMELIGSFMDEEQRAEVERLKERAGKLLDGVNWSQMAGKEFVFAERMPKLTMRDGNPNVGMPGMVWMFQSRDGGAAESYAGLVKILEAVAEEVNAGAQEGGLEGHT